MKLKRLLGTGLCVFSIVSLGAATHSTITDRENGNAANIVETNNVIHVYTYTGASSEATFLSTFDEGETWSQPASTTLQERRNTIRTTSSNQLIPVRYSRTNRSSAKPVESDYVKAVDDCLAKGKWWDYKDDVCVERY